MSSIIYRFVPVKRRYRHLFKQVRTLSLICLKQGMEKKEVLTALFNFLEEQKRISLSREQFDLLLDSFDQELATRLIEPKKEKVKKVKNRNDIKVSKPLNEEELEFLEFYMDDYNWTIRFEGEFPKDYRVPLFLLKHVA
jgi:hypothetical protein